MSAWISWNSDLSEALFNILAWPHPLISARQRDALLWRKARSSNLSPSCLSYKFCATLTHRTTEVSLKGQCFSISMERKGQACGCSVEIQHPVFPLGLTMGICCANVEGGLCDCFGNKIFAGRLEFTCFSDFFYWNPKRTILWSAGREKCSQKQKIIAIDVEGKTDTSFIRQQTESRYCICFRMCTLLIGHNYN